MQHQHRMAGLADPLPRPSDADHQRRRPVSPAGLAGAVRVIDQRSAGQIALADARIDQHGARLERAHQAIEIIQQFSVLMQVAQMRQLGEMGRTERLSVDLRTVMPQEVVFLLDAVLSRDDRAVRRFPVEVTWSAPK